MEVTGNFTLRPAPTNGKDGKDAPSISLGVTCHNGESSQVESEYIAINGEKQTIAPTCHDVFVDAEGEVQITTIYDESILFTRGTHLFFIDKNTLELQEWYRADTYGYAILADTLGDIILRHRAEHSEDIVVLMTSDAASCNQYLRNQLALCGGLEEGIYEQVRRRHFFVGQFADIRPTQGYEEISEDPTLKEVSVQVVKGIGIVRNGSVGEDGLLIRRTEWQSGMEYRNDTEHKEKAIDGNYYLDEVTVSSYRSGQGQTFMCRKQHTASIINQPKENTTSEYWQPMNEIAPIKTPYADITAAFIEFLQSRQLTIVDENGKKYGAFGGGNIPLWFGNEDNPTTAFLKDGSARLANGNFTYDAQGNIEMTGKLSSYDANGHLVSTYNENGDGTIVYYYAQLETKDDNGEPIRIKMKEDIFTYNEDGSIKGMQTRYYNTDGTLRWYINEVGQSGASESYWEFFEGGEWKEEDGTISNIKIALYHHPNDDGAYYSYNNAIWDNSDGSITQDSAPPIRTTPLATGTYTIYGKWIPAERKLPSGLIQKYSYRDNKRVVYTNNSATFVKAYNVSVVIIRETKDL